MQSPGMQKCGSALVWFRNGVEVYCQIVSDRGRSDVKKLTARVNKIRHGICFKSISAVKASRKLVL